MQSLLTNLKQKHSEVKAAISDLLLRHSRIEAIPTQEVRVRSNSPADRLMSNMPFFVGPQYHTILSVGSVCFQSLDSNGQRAQKMALELYRDYFNIVSAILVGYPANLRNQANKSNRIIKQATEQTGTPISDDLQKMLDTVKESLDQQLSLLASFAQLEHQEPILVLDTNALLHNPSLENWSFDEFPKFELVLVPTVLEELDRFQSQHSNSDLREKAKGLITRIKGYRNRGKLSDGVPLRKGISTLRSFQLQNTIDYSLFSDDKPDSRILANCFEIARSEFGRPVGLVTRDVHLQNRAEFFCLSFLEPPD